MLEEFIGIGTLRWWMFTAIVLASRGCDLGSTWLATPNLTLEANPFARRLGWKAGILLNLFLGPAFACWPMLAISLSTTSLLVAARNLQHAWLMRSLGEAGYRMWFSDRVAESPRWLVFGSFLAEAGLTGIIGAALMATAKWQLVPFAIGLGVSGYAVAVAVFTTLSLWRR